MYLLLFFGLSQNKMNNFKNYCLRCMEIDKSSEQKQQDMAFLNLAEP